MIAWLTLLGISFVGTVFWVVSAEVSAVVYASELGWPPLWVALTCSFGQLGAHLLLYAGGDQLARRWSWLGRQGDRVKARFGDRLQRSYLSLSALAAVTGLPPAVGMTTLAAGFGARILPYMTVLFLGRLVRFGLLALGGPELWDLLGLRSG